MKKRKRKLQYYTVILVYEDEHFHESRTYFQTLAYSWKDAKKRAEKNAISFQLPHQPITAVLRHR